MCNSTPYLHFRGTSWKRNRRDMAEKKVRHEVKRWNIKVMPNITLPTFIQRRRKNSSILVGLVYLLFFSNINRIFWNFFVAEVHSFYEQKVGFFSLRKISLKDTLIALIPTPPPPSNRTKVKEKIGLNVGNVEDFRRKCNIGGLDREGVGYVVIYQWLLWIMYQG